MDGPFRASSRSCPRCNIELSNGELGGCKRCHGVWVTQEALHARVETMQGDKPYLAYASCLKHDEPRAAIACVTCGDPMETLLLFDVPIDRCKSHGVWFDHEELERVLFAARHHSQKIASGPETNACTACELELRATAKELSKPKPTESKAGIALGVVEVLAAIFSSL